MKAKEFLRYLRANPNSIFRRGIPCYCPLAAWLGDKYQTKVSVDRKTAIVYRNEDNLDLDLPLWARRFINEVDNSWGGEIYTEECLEIMKDLRKYMKQEGTWDGA